MPQKHLRYLITFACYGSHIHGEERGSVDRNHNRHGGPAYPFDVVRLANERSRMRDMPYLLDHANRTFVLESIKEVRSQRDWPLIAAHVRTNHVHTVVESEVHPDKIMNTFKAYASRRLNAVEGCKADRRRWARQGSTRWLWKDDWVIDAVGMWFMSRETQWQYFWHGVGRQDNRALLRGYANDQFDLVGQKAPLPHGRGSVEIAVRREECTF